MGSCAEMNVKQDAFTYGAVNPILPFLLGNRIEIAAGRQDFWISILFTAMGAGELITAPICGWLADQTSSRKVPLLFGLLLQGGAIALFGISTSIWVLVISRALSGMSSSIVYTVALALVIDTVGPHEVGQWMGTTLSVANVGIVISPVIGGGVYARAGVWGVLLFMIALIILDIILRLLVIEQKVAKRYYIQASGNTIETDGPPSNRIGPSSPDAVSQDLRGQAKKLQVPPILHLLRSPRILSAWYGVFTQVGILVSFEATLPLFVRRTFGWNSLGAGLIFLTLGIPCAFGPLVGKLSDKFGPRRIALVGCVFATPPVILLRLVERESHA